MSLRDLLLLLAWATGCGPVETDSLAGAAVQPGRTTNGAALNGRKFNGRKFNGRKFNGRKFNGVTLEGAAFEGLTVRGSALVASVSGGSLAGAALKGAVLDAELDDGTRARLRIDDVTASPEADDVLLYSISFEGDAGWEPLCDSPPSGGPAGRAIVLTGTWDDSAAHPPGRDGPGDLGGGARTDEPGALTFACEGYVLAKCVELGYRPWAPRPSANVSMADLHQSCTRLLRADYCGDGTPHTRDGTEVDVSDLAGVVTPETEWSTEATFSPAGATCVSAQRYLTVDHDDVTRYVTEHCPDVGQFAVGADYDCVVGAWTGAPRVPAPGTLLYAATAREAVHVRVPLFIVTSDVAPAPYRLGGEEVPAARNLWFSAPIVDDLSRPQLGAEVTAVLERDGAQVHRQTTSAQTYPLAENSTWALFGGPGLDADAGELRPRIESVRGTTLPWDDRSPPVSIAARTASIESLRLRQNPQALAITLTLGPWGRTSPGTTTLVTLQVERDGAVAASPTAATDGNGVLRLTVPGTARHTRVRVVNVTVMIDTTRAQSLGIWDGAVTAAEL